MSEILDGEPARRIVVGLDLSEAGDRALREALRLSQKLSSCELHVVHAARIRRELRAWDRMAQLAEALHACMDTLRAHAARICRAVLEPQSAPCTVFHVRIGEAVDVLQQLALETGADLIVVGARPGAQGAARARQDSIAAALRRSVPVPVLVARTAEAIPN